MWFLGKYATVIIQITYSNDVLLFDMYDLAIVIYIKWMWFH